MVAIAVFITDARDGRAQQVLRQKRDPRADIGMVDLGIGIVEPEWRPAVKVEQVTGAAVVAGDKGGIDMWRDEFFLPPGIRIVVAEKRLLGDRLTGVYWPEGGRTEIPDSHIVTVAAVIGPGQATMHGIRRRLEGAKAGFRDLADLPRLQPDSVNIVDAFVTPVEQHTVAKRDGIGYVDVGMGKEIVPGILAPVIEHHLFTQVVDADNGNLPRPLAPTPDPAAGYSPGKRPGTTPGRQSAERNTRKKSFRRLVSTAMRVSPVTENAGDDSRE